MSRYIDAEWLLGVAKLSNGVVDIDDIYNAPTIDAVRVVRCKDCKYKDDIVNYCYENDRNIKVNDFCSYGECKESE